MVRIKRAFLPGANASGITGPRFVPSVGRGGLAPGRYINGDWYSCQKNTKTGFIINFQWLLILLADSSKIPPLSSSCVTGIAALRSGCSSLRQSVSRVVAKCASKGRGCGIPNHCAYMRRVAALQKGRI